MEHTDTSEDQLDPIPTAGDNAREGGPSASTEGAGEDPTHEAIDGPAATDSALPDGAGQLAATDEPAEPGEAPHVEAERPQPSIDFSDEEVLAAAGMGGSVAPEPPEAHEHSQETTSTRGTHRRWRRPTEDRLIAGVAAAIADGAGLPLWFVRAGFAVGALFGGLGIAAYLGAWAILPSGDATHSLSDRWRDRWNTADGPGERAGLIVIAAAVLLGISATGVVAGPVTLAVVLALVGISMLQPKSV